MELLYKEEAFQIIGACMNVHNELGCGFHEKVYQEALEIELLSKSLPFEREKQIKIFYKNIELRKYYYVDFLCFDKIVLEIKALPKLMSDHDSQLINYLKVSKTRLGFLINFGTKSLQTKRIVL